MRRQYARFELSQDNREKAFGLFADCVTDVADLVDADPQAANQEALGLCFYSRGLAEQTERDITAARSDYEEAVRALRHAWHDPTLPRAAQSFILALRNLAVVLQVQARQTLPDRQAAVTLLNQGLKYDQEAASVARGAHTAAVTDETTRDLVDSLGDLSWNLLLVQQFKEAEARGEEALSFDADQVRIETRLAHAYLLQGRLDKALPIYLKIKDKPAAEHVKDDYAFIRDLGIPTVDNERDMKIVEEKLGIARPPG